jgi:hypothetical protein
MVETSNKLFNMLRPVSLSPMHNCCVFFHPCFEWDAFNKMYLLARLPQSFPWSLLRVLISGADMVERGKEPCGSCNACHLLTLLRATTRLTIGKAIREALMTNPVQLRAPGRNAQIVRAGW